uniref:Immunoglobulin domain-containing protein n=1 Tax=Terrapene triunguis TaxID=2587831 RepID=A0A674JVR4_9SAUR
DWKSPSPVLCLSPGSHPKPSISVSPGGVIPVGGNVTIRCWHQLLGLRFLLYKAGAGNYLAYTDPAGSEAEFPITSARREHGGSYTCRYSNRTGRAAYLEPSDPVHIIVTGEGYPKPNISMSPRGEVSLGGAATVWCRGQRRGVWFVLNKERHHFPPVDSDGFGAVFPISNVSREHGGSYSCSYHSRSEPFAVSYPSDPMELVVRGEGPGSASPEVIALGGAVTIRCQCRCGARRLFLYKGGIEIRELDAAGDGGEFTIPRARSEPSSWSDPSDIVWIVVGSYPKPSISISPGGVIPVGGNVTIWCGHQYPGMRFLLYKAGDGNYLTYTDPVGYVAEFPITSARREHSGSYTCRSTYRTGPAAYSEPSDPVQIIVAGEGPNPAPHDWTLETGLACLLLGSRALGPQGLGLIRVSCC